MTIKHQDEWGRIQYGSGTNRIITAVRQVSSQFDNAYGYTLKLVGVGACCAPGYATPCVYTMATRWLCQMMHDGQMGYSTIVPSITWR